MTTTIDIIENSLFILCKHLEFYYLSCVPTDREVSTLQDSSRGRTKPRGLQGLFENYNDSMVMIMMTMHDDDDDDDDNDMTCMMKVPSWW